MLFRTSARPTVTQVAEQLGGPLDVGEEEGDRGTSLVKPIRYTQHAKDRMAERGVSAAEIESVMNAPAITVPDRLGRAHVIGCPGEMQRAVAAEEGMNLDPVLRSVPLQEPDQCVREPMTGHVDDTAGLCAIEHTLG